MDLVKSHFNTNECLALQNAKMEQIKNRKENHEIYFWSFGSFDEKMNLSK